jgi:uncharacterized RDD family membrane protein YckC
MGGISAQTCPRADFWSRLGALVIDIVLVAVGVGVTPLVPGGLFPWAMGVFLAAMWAWKGTTVGGVVLNLKVVRLDDRPIDPATAIVRTIIGYISLMTLVGFLWCIWDSEQQTWHDKVAGTVVVRTPKGASLV